MFHTILTRERYGTNTKGRMIRVAKRLSRKGRGMERRVAYVFLYKNGIRERSVGIVRRYGTAEQPEVALELFGAEIRKKRWRMYYFTENEALAEAAYLWGITTERGRSEAKLSQCRLCTEAGAGRGIVLLPEKGNGPEKAHCTGQEKWVDRTAFREYLCARYDGKEVTEEELKAAFGRKPEAVENPRIESAKKLMEEITKAAEGGAGTDEMPEKQGTETEEAGRIDAETVGQSRGKPSVHRKMLRNRIAGLEKLLLTKAPYVPCRSFDVDYSVRVLPEELECLENKGYIENSYLLHGYYRYRHVLLGRRKRKEKEEYVLLVPGRYSEKEAGLAELFGFPEFLPMLPETGGAASGKEPFGYFCGKI